MSALRATSDIGWVPENRPRPALSVIDGGRSRSRFAIVRTPVRAWSKIPFAILCATILGAALVGVLLLNTRMVNGSYELARLQWEAARAAQDVQMLHEQVREAQAGLPASAAAIGMVPAEQPTPLEVGGIVVLTAEELQAVPGVGDWPADPQPSPSNATGAALDAVATPTDSGDVEAGQ